MGAIPLIKVDQLHGVKNGRLDNSSFARVAVSIADIKVRF
jgi:hypothetical protein